MSTSKHHRAFLMVKGEHWLLHSGPRSLYTIASELGIEPWALFLGRGSSLIRTYLLVYGLSAGYRRANKLDVSLDKFIDGDYLPEYLSPEWAELQTFLDDFISVAYPALSLLQGALSRSTAADQANDQLAVLSATRDIQDAKAALGIPAAESAVRPLRATSFWGRAWATIKAAIPLMGRVCR